MAEENKTQIHKVETLSADMVKVLQNPGEGLIKDIIRQEEAHEEEKKNFSPETGKNKWMVAGSAVLVLAAIVGLFLYFFNKDALVLDVKPQFSPLIYTDESVILPVDNMKKDQIAEVVRARLAISEVEEDGVEGVYLTVNKNAVGLRKFVDLIGGTLTASKNEFFDDNFLLGVVNRDTTDLFMLFKIRSHTDVFETMRDWEYKMFSDLHGFFGVPIAPETSYLLTKDFVDAIVQNQNARVLYDKDGGIVMAYIYGDDNSLIITNTESAAREVIIRLASSRVKK